MRRVGVPVPRLGPSCRQTHYCALLFVHIPTFSLLHEVVERTSWVTVALNPQHPSVHLPYTLYRSDWSSSFRLFTVHGLQNKRLSFVSRRSGLPSSFARAGSGDELFDLCD